jgi:hypothetical protein
MLPSIVASTLIGLVLGRLTWSQQPIGPALRENTWHASVWPVLQPSCARETLAPRVARQLVALLLARLAREQPMAV